MSKLKLGIFSAVILASIAVPALFQYQAQVGLRVENEALRQEKGNLARLSADNERLSNIVAQAKVALASADERFEELLKLRAEVSRLSQEKQESNRLDQDKLVQSVSEQLRELASLRGEVSGLSRQISELREEIQELPAAAASSSSVESPSDRAAEPVQNGEAPSLSVRMIPTQGETFAEKLKRSVSAQENETFQEVFGRFLQANGVNLGAVAGFGYNERTGRVIVRGSQAALDQIERLTIALDRAQ